MLPDTPHTRLARRLAEDFSRFPQVEAVALAGSLGAQTGDSTSDIDLYIYVNAPIPVSERAALVKRYGASRADLDLNFWDPGDEWVHAESGIEVDVMFWDPRWIEDQLDHVLVRCEASMGYTTCFWNTLHHSAVLFDRHGWFTGLKARTDQPYPDTLRNAIIAKNHAVLRRVIPGYAHQIEKAWRRGDWISVNHRVAALFASYFDVIFALNRVLHPGEKRLLTYAADHCALLPADMASQVTEVLRAAAPGSSDLPERVCSLLDNLDALLTSQGFDPQTSLPR